MNRFEKLLFGLILTLFFAASWSYTAYADRYNPKALKDLLEQPELWRFSNVTLVEIDKNVVTQIIGESGTGGTANIGAGAGVDFESLPDCEKGIINACVLREGARCNPVTVLNDIRSNCDANTSLTVNDLRTIVQERLGSGGQEAKIRKVWVLTTRPDNSNSEGANPVGNIIGIVAYRSQMEDLTQSDFEEDFVNSLGSPFTLTFGEMELKEKDGKNLLDEVQKTLNQNQYTLATEILQNIVTVKLQDQIGSVESLISNSLRPSDKDLQELKLVSEGQPLKFPTPRTVNFATLEIRGKTRTEYLTNILLVSPDKISYKKYDTTKVLENVVLPIIQESVNDFLPVYGFELKYGIDELMYPSFWSERLSLSAIFKNVKMGIILPAGSYLSGSETFPNIERKLVSGKGFGVVGELNFASPIIQRSGVWQMNFGYQFGDPAERTWNERPEASVEISPDQCSAFTNTNDLDYFIRGNAQLHYTFGLKIDNDHLLRLGLGGTYYGVEKWYKSYSFDDSIAFACNSQYEMYDEESIVGISGKIDFMAKNVVTPYGASLLYFNESMGYSGWLLFQAPFVKNMFLKLSASGYAPIFKDDPEPWENESVIVPMLRIMYIF